MAIVPDEKDWTWVLGRACPDCGFDPAGVRPSALADRIAASADGWGPRLDAPDALARPDDATWSPLEYGCHVRDVHHIMRERLELILAQDDPVFDNWDQDAAAVERAYSSQDPAVVAVEIASAARLLEGAYRRVPDGSWQREGRRTGGSRFTAQTLGVYALHDLEHHRMDVGLS
ncbi:DinB family protein [Tsukamurella sp. 8F]|uniref:DinB family protein n=1 Tax=unclassified Tsukamurella TaxID=2633480 RepID=UPI0023B952D8|nr:MULTISPECIES: DinB family protein [unclassified Tsukamurella]MDF0530161.1 DinB family protein [Tsukamurella sp. 8J]MDF0586479.1 DinB family protein [Tsukamurella sp. 8F]